MIGRSKLILGLGAVVLLAGGLVPVLAHDPHEAPSSLPFNLDSPRHPSPLTAKYIGLETAEVDFGVVRRVVRLTGTVRALPERQYVVTSAVAGTLTKLDIKLGQRVIRGQPIGEVQSADLARLVNEMHKTEIEYEHSDAEVANTTSNLAQLRTQVTAAITQAELLEQEVARLEQGGEAVGGNLLSQKRSAAVQQRAQVATLTISLAQAERTIISLGRMKAATGQSIDAMRSAIEIIHAHPAGTNMDEERKAEGEAGGVILLHAPIDGLVTRRDAVLGQGVEPGKGIVTIADYSEVLVEGELPESMMEGFGESIGAEVRVRRPGSPAGDTPIAIGTVRGMSPTVDPIKRTAHVLISVPNTAAWDLKEGMFVSLAVSKPQDVDAAGSGGVVGRMVVVPVAAVVSDGPMLFVFVKDNDAYVKRDILPGVRDDRFIEIKDGLVPGDVVVTHGAYLLTQLRPASAAAPEEHHHDH